MVRRNWTRTNGANMAAKLAAIFLLGVLGETGSLSNAAEPFEPSADDIFGPIFESYEMKNVLYICDILKDCTMACNITDQGARKLRVEGSHRAKWKISDGFLRKNFLQVDYLPMVARCAFQKAYYECFGVVKCPDGPDEPCFGGEAWRGNYNGNPRKGFAGNITAEAMSGAGNTDPDAEALEMANQPSPEPAAIERPSEPFYEQTDESLHAAEPLRVRVHQKCFKLLGRRRCLNESP